MTVYWSQEELRAVQVLLPFISRIICLKADGKTELMREANQLVGKTFDEVTKHVVPGVPTLQLDKIVKELTGGNGAVPTFLGHSGFPSSIYASVSGQVVYGIPSSKMVSKEGDVISTDCGTILNGFAGDSTCTFRVGEVALEMKKLSKATKGSLYLGVQCVVKGRRLGDISSAIQTYCEPQSYFITRELVGHGIGRKMHEKPEALNYSRRGCGLLLRNGVCICIKPMINMGSKNAAFEKDRWTVHAKDRKPSTHFEHCIAIRPDGPQILSSSKFLEGVLEGNAI